VTKVPYTLPRAMERSGISNPRRGSVPDVSDQKGSRDDCTDNRTEEPFLTATASAQGLGGFPIGSLESRAAARCLIAARATLRATLGEEQGVTFVCVDVVTGKIVNLKAPAEGG
jgi:hypothetical protein